jgi:hypothetical protein
MKDSNYDGSCTGRHSQFASFKISGHLIFVGLSVQEAGWALGPIWMTENLASAKIRFPTVQSGASSYTNYTILATQDCVVVR